MRITIQSQGFDLTEALRSHVELRLRTTLGWTGARLRRLAVFLSDINGPRGGVDKRCKIEVQLAGRKPVVIEDTEADMYVAIDRAAGRAGRALVRKVRRQREFAHVRPDASLPERPGADELDTPDSRDY